MADEELFLDCEDCWQNNGEWRQTSSPYSSDCCPYYDSGHVSSRLLDGGQREEDLLSSLSSMTEDSVESSSSLFSSKWKMTEADEEPPAFFGGDDTLPECGDGHRCSRRRRSRRRCHDPSPQTAVWASGGFAAVVLMSCLGVIWARPSPGLLIPPGSSRLSDHEKHYRELQSKAVKYLAEFGYLTGPSRETGNLMSAGDLSKAIKVLQAMGNLPQTGVIDRRTEELMSKPRCGNLDTLMGVIPGQGRSDLGQNKWPIDEPGRRGRGRGRRKRYVEAPSKWHKKNLTFKILNYTPDIKLDTVREIILDAFTLWSNATQLQFIEVMFGNADILIQFASRYHQDGYPFDGKGMILAHAFFPGVGKGGDTHFDDDEYWTTNSSDGVDLFMVAAHEFGHALGLAHSAEPGALMYPWYQGFSGKFELPRDDARGIQKLYGLPQEDREFPVPLIPGVGGEDNDSSHQGKDDDDSPEGSDNQPPDPCTAPFDAVTIIRSEVFLFIGKWFWRLDSRGVVKDPVHIHKFWYGLPAFVNHIDAVLERQGDKRILFFSNDSYWVFNANTLVSGFPKNGLPITEFGIPPDVKKIDTVYTWGFNKRTYLVAGDMYWKLNENNSLVEYDYPRDMSIWRGVPVPLDAAFQYWDGKNYFFKGRKYWKFYDARMRIDPTYPRLIADDWLQCSGDGDVSNIVGDKPGGPPVPPSSGAKLSPSTTSVCVLVVLLCVGWKWKD